MSTYEKEYFAILLAVDSWRHYLMQNEFVIHTDQKNLVHLNEQCLHTLWQQKVFYKLLGLRYKVVYHRSVDNGMVDALSHRQHPESLMMCPPYLIIGCLHCKIGIFLIMKLLPCCLG